MKQVINGKLYDTDTATLLAEWDNGKCYGDYNYLDEELYRTKKGSYFIYGEGGANTRYCKPCGAGNWRSGEEISPVTEQEAREWAETHVSGEKYISIFGAVEEA